MILYLVCVTTMGLSNIVLTVPFNGQLDNSHYAYTTCSVHNTLKEAAIHEYERDKASPISRGYYNSTEKQQTFYYKLDVEKKSMDQIQEPRIRLEVDEK